MSSWFTFFLFVLAVMVWFAARKLQASSGLPAGRVVYSDTSQWYEAEPLFHPQLRLTGKPDYLVEEANGELIPVELKSGRAPTAPHEGHVMQLAAYCALVEEVYGLRPGYGIIQYRDKAFAVDYTPELENELYSLLVDMRIDLHERDLPRSHNEPGRCSACGLRNVCNQKLA